MKIPKELKTVTSLSKALSFIVVLALPLIAFFWGVKFQHDLDSQTKINSEDYVNTTITKIVKWEKYPSNMNLSFNYPSSLFPSAANSQDIFFFKEKKDADSFSECIKEKKAALVCSDDFIFGVSIKKFAKNNSYLNLKEKYKPLEVPLSQFPQPFRDKENRIWTVIYRNESINNLSNSMAELEVNNNYYNIVIAKGNGYNSYFKNNDEINYMYFVQQVLSTFQFN